MPIVFSNEDYAECDGQYYDYINKTDAINACRRDDSCNGIIGVISGQPINACDDIHTQFHLCKALRVSHSYSSSHCFLKKRYGNFSIFDRQNYN